MTSRVLIIIRIHHSRFHPYTPGLHLQTIAKHELNQRGVSYCELGFGRADHSDFGGNEKTVLSVDYYFPKMYAMMLDHL